MTNKTTYTDPKLYTRPALLLLLLTLLAIVNFPESYGWLAGWVPDSVIARWAFTMVLIGAFGASVSQAGNGSWRALFIDSRNRVSLSRLQFLAWSLVVISSLLAFAGHNSRQNLGFDIEIPTQLLVAMGISTVSLVGSPALLAAKRRRKPDPTEVKDVSELVSSTQQATLKGAKATDSDGGRARESVVVEYESLKDARWVQAFTGDETGTAGHIDLGKMQMFFFTFVLLLSYGSEIADLLRDPAPIEAFPAISDGMNELLGLSHTGYLANKTVSHSREAKPDAAEAAAEGGG